MEKVGQSVEALGGSYRHGAGAGGFSLLADFPEEPLVQCSIAVLQQDRVSFMVEAQLAAQSRGDQAAMRRFSALFAAIESRLSPRADGRRQRG